MSEKRKFVKIVVLGDLGRSPRMQYHGKSLAEMGHQVDVIAYGDTDPMDSIKLDPAIFYHYLFPIPQLVMPRLLFYIVKTMLQSINLFFLLFITSKSDLLVMQNPPAIPAMIVCWIYARIVGAKFVIDWHNYAHTIMALNVGEYNPLVKITKKVEVALGQKADYNFCVTRAMKSDLLNNYKIDAITLYDRPPMIFKPISLDQKHEFMVKCGQMYDKTFSSSDDESAFTKVVDGIVELKDNRPGLLVSSTSWTEDEDFSVLLTSLQDYEKHCLNANTRKLPNLICVITGKGPLKNFYLKKITLFDWKHVTIITPWLEIEDYPLILASADLGVSLHTSSSGLDLPMKVVDMFGCGLPVCAFNFKCLNELVKNGENGYTFTSSDELSGQIIDWFDNFPNNHSQKQTERKFKTELDVFQNLRWKENWELVAGPIFK